MKNYLKRYYIVWIIFIGLLALDLITKAIFDDVNFTVIPHILTFCSTKNTGSAFSLFSSNTLALTIISCFFILFIIVFDKFYKVENTLYKISYSLIISGATGNLIDRIFFGYVRDFIRLDFFDFTGINTVFNIADICVTFGVICMFIYILFLSPKEKKND